MKNLLKKLALKHTDLIDPEYIIIDFQAVPDKGDVGRVFYMTLANWLLLRAKRNRERAATVIPSQDVFEGTYQLWIKGKGKP